MLLRLCIFMVLLPSQIFAQQTINGFKRYGRAEAVPNSSINKLFESSDKFLWLSTSSGLYRFDGFRFTPFFSDSKDSSTLSSNVLYDIEEDRLGNLWVATFGKGVNKLNRKTGKWKRYIHPTKDNNPFYWIFDLFKDHRGNMWLGSSGRGLLLYDEKADSFKQFIPSVLKNKTGTVRFENEVRGIAADKLNPDMLWLAGTDGLYRFNTKQQTFVCFTNKINGQEKWINNSFHNIYVQDAGNIWLGAWGGGLVHFNTATNTFTNYPPYPAEYARYNLAQNIITDIAFCTDTSLYVSTSSDGLFEFHLPKRTFKKISEEPMADVKNITTPFYSITHSSDGSTWICSAENIFQKHPVYNRLGNFQSFYQPENKFVYRPALSSLLYVKSKQQYWMSCNAGYGVYVYDSSFHYLGSIPIEGNASDRRLRDIVMDAAGNTWLLSRDAPYLYRYDAAKNKFTNASPWFKDPSFINADLQEMAVDAKGKLWWVNSNQLLTWDTVLQQLKSYRVEPVTNNAVKWKSVKIKFDHNDDPWIAANVGLFHFKKNQVIFEHLYYRQNDLQSLANSSVTAICFDKKGICYIAPEDEGLQLYNPAAHKFTTHYTRAAGFISQRINYLEADSDGNIWAVTINGLARYNIKQNRWFTFNIDDGLTTDRLYEPLFAMADGTMILSVGQGFVHWKIGNMPSSKQKPIVYFSSIASSEKILPIDNNKLLLPYYGNNLNIEFSAIATVMGSRTSFYYKMLPRQKAWIAATQRSISLAGFAGGEYTLQVKAINADGVESDIKEIHISVAYPLWQRWWFITFCFAIIAGILYVAYRYRVAQLLKMEQMRNHISRDLHDEIGSSVSSVNILSNVAKDQLGDGHPVTPLLTQIGLSAQNAGDSINEIIWSLHPQNDSMQRMVLRMKELTAEMLEFNNINYTINFDTQLNHINIPLQHRRHLFLIYKEALNNMIKYAHCKNAFLSIQIKEQILLMKIEDDGIGFDLLNYIPGNGLKNMEERAKEMKAQLITSTAAGKGCSILVLYPLK
jgi:signal transduction histidine kinase/ligand-binding sensor domain-containing protein